MCLRHLETKVMGCLHLPRGGTSRRLRVPLDRPLPNPNVPVALALHWVNDPFLISLRASLAPASVSHTGTPLVGL